MSGVTFQFEGLATPPSGTVVATDEHDGQQYQRVKLDLGAAGQSQPVVNAMPVAIADGANLDAFSRLRTSNPEGIFDCQFTYGLQPILFEQITAETGATIAHDDTNRCGLFTFDATPTGGKALMQSFEHVRYQPGRSQAVFVTFNFRGSAANVTKFAGYSDGTNGVELRLTTGGATLGIYSGTDHGEMAVAQANWNRDPMDGTGTSGITLDLTKTQILVIDMQALYVGRVRVGFDVGGLIVYVHEFLHANIDAVPYIQSASLPIRCGMTSTGEATTTMLFVCSAVLSEGGQEDTSGASFTVDAEVTAASGARTHALSVQPALTIGGITNRQEFVLDAIDLIALGNNPLKWELVLGQALSGTTAFAAVNATYSGTEFNVAGTLSGAPAVVIAQGYVAASAQAKSAAQARLTQRYPLTLDAAGAHRVNGRFTLLVTGLGAPAPCRIALNWREVR